MRERVPIGIFLWSFQPGGTERQTIELIRRLSRERFDVHVACFHREGAWLPRAEELASSSDIESSLSSYVRRRKARVETIMRVSRDVGTDGQLSGMIECWLRNRRARRAGRDKARMLADLERLLAFR